MKSHIAMRKSVYTVMLLAGVAATSACVASSKPIPLPDAKNDAPLAAGKEQVAVFAGGCFWGVEAVFEHTKGVKRVESGYAGGSASTAKYALIGTGRTGHAESVRIVYDPAQISYGQLLKVFFSVAHDPTQLNRQGPDSGTQYRSGIFTASELQTKIATAYIAQLDAAKRYTQPIVTKVEPLKAFYPAEGYHQDFARLNPNHPYIVINDAPKVVALQTLLPALYRSR
jgi:peptide-methionine (S)-S-oxide reductase